MEVREGIDCASKITPDIAKKLKDAGKTFVARYLVPAKYEWKRLSHEEAKAISDAGLDILSVFESTASRAVDGYEAGKSDARAALEEVKRVGQPRGSAIYFAVDFDVTKPEQMDAIERYLQGAASILGADHPVGVYGEYDVIEEMKKRGAAKHFWQTYAWSKGKKSAHANVFQYKNGQSLAGITVDLNNSFGNEGFWTLNPKAKPKTKFTDVEAGRWSEDAIAAVSKAGLMVGYPDGTFGPDKLITREEVASILVRLLNRKEDSNG